MFRSLSFLPLWFLSKSTVLGSPRAESPSGYLHTQGCFEHTLHQRRSIAVSDILGRQERMEFENDGVVTDPQQIKNPIDWDFRTLGGSPSKLVSWILY